ncbi:hypothetical protein ZIOFF_069976 [Zingiber officinale]|uniref:Uncharacterized protein n=1 Tax=Zingiber officinale TaxID=94328 RepID=A0A8J5CWC9_ZINOF|nr:hypothetical protein ZIOFF_069976 [Zingiber officinale]
MTTSSTASALILAIIVLLVAPLSPGNFASTREGNTLFFSFGGSGKNRSFATEFAHYGDAEMNSSEVRVTRAVNESSGLMIYWKPVRFFGTKPGFFPSYLAAAMQWLCLRLDMLSSVVFAFSLLFLISMPRGVIDPGISGLAVTYGLNLNKYMTIDSEPPLSIESNKLYSSWPFNGEIELHNLQSRSFSYLQASLTNDATVSVNRCLWSPKGSILGVAFSKHLVQIYAFNLNEELRQHLEIDAHIDSVNDIAFSYPKKTLSIITCGDDKAIKVSKTMWLISQKIVQEELYVLNSVSLFLSVKFFFSTSTDGKIKGWSYEGLRSRVSYEAPGHWCTTMAYSADGTRLFSCGTSKDGDSHLVEWNETGPIKQTYNGFRKHSLGVVQFDTTRNRFLAFPQLRFQKDGSLLAVTTSDNGIKILANADGQRVLRMLEVSRSVSKQSNSNVKAVVDSTRAADVKPRIREETERIISWKLTEIVNVGHLKTLRLPDSTSAVSKVVRLIYTNSGCSLLALGSNASTASVAPQLRQPPNGILMTIFFACSPTASVAPQLRQPPNGILMTNERSDNNPEEATACIALSKNDSYATSASGENQTQGPLKKDNRLAFSPSLNVLVSARADAQLCVWSMGSWKKKNSRFIQAFTGCTSPLVGDIQIQFHNVEIVEISYAASFTYFEGKITLIDIGNNEIGPKGAFSIAEFVKKTKSLLQLNLYMNDIGDAFTNLKYSRVEIDEVRFEWAECMLDYI